MRDGYDRLPSRCGEVDLGERLVDQALLVGTGERLAGDLLGGGEAELADLVADLAERLLRRLLDLAAGLLEPALAVFLGLLPHALALRVGDAAGLGEDLLRLDLRLADQLAVLLEQAARLGARAVGLVDRVLDALAPRRRSSAGPGRTRSSSARTGRDEEADDRPDHQPRRDLDQRVGCEHVELGSPLDEDVREDRAEQAVEHDRLGEGEAEPLDALQLAAQLGLAGDRLDHRAEDVADADAGAERAETDAEREADRLAGLGDVGGRCGEDEYASMCDSS